MVVSIAATACVASETERPDTRMRTDPPTTLPTGLPELGDPVTPDFPPLPAPAESACREPGTTLFRNISDCAGLQNALHIVPGMPDLASGYVTGQAWADFDHDTWLDLVVTSPTGTNRLYRGRADGTFLEATPSTLSGIAAYGAVVADVDHDEWVDLFLTGIDDDTLIVNQGGSLFEAPGPVDPGMTLGASFVDIDGDGQLELFTANYHCLECDPMPGSCPSSRDGLWFEDSGVWEDRIEQMFAEPAYCGMAFQGVWGDYDNDGDLDLYVGNDKGNPTEPDGDITWRNTFWQNDGAGCGSSCFTEQSSKNGSEAWLNSMGVDAGDLDNDGDLDLIVSGTGQPVLLVNHPEGFVDETVDRNLALGGTEHMWGVIWLDYDNDADLDLFIGATDADRLFRNEGSWFTEVFEFDQPDDATRGAAAADYDRDGHVDLVVGQVGGAYKLLRNHDTSSNHWLGLRLVGSGAGGTSALGARVTVTDSLGRTQMREVKSGSSNGSGSDLGLHFGLGPADIERIVIRWPDGSEHDVTVMVDRWTEIRRDRL